MTPLPTILIVDDDEGHAILIRENLEAAGLSNDIKHFRDGQAVLDFFFKGPPPAREPYLVLLDIRMPKVDGIEVLRRLKATRNPQAAGHHAHHHGRFPRSVERCHELGCNVYIQAPGLRSVFWKPSAGSGVLYSF